MKRAISPTNLLSLCRHRKVMPRSLWWIEGGDNIDIWSIDELKDIVDRFVEKAEVKETPTPEEETKEEESPVAAGNTPAVIKILY